jgi:hypothetical protein
MRRPEGRAGMVGRIAHETDFASSAIEGSTGGDI